MLYVCVCVCKHTLSHFSHVWLFATLCTIAHQAPLSTGFSRQEYWSGLPYLSPGDLPNPQGTEPMSLMSTILAGEFFTTSTTWEAIYIYIYIYIYKFWFESTEHKMWNFLHQRGRKLNIVSSTFFCNQRSRFYLGPCEIVTLELATRSEVDNNHFHWDWKAVWRNR